MSFDVNPFRSIELIRDDDCHTVVHCGSCGWSSPEYSEITSVHFFFQMMAIHVKKSHKLTAEDFKGWSPV